MIPQQSLNKKKATDRAYGSVAFFHILHPDPNLSDVTLSLLTTYIVNIN